MRTRNPSLLIVVIAALCAPATASAAFQHVVAPGESLSSVAATDGLSVSQLAAANGISPDSQLISGSLLAIPPQDGQDAVAAGSTADSSSGTDSESSEAASAATPATGTTDSGSGYLVQPGDTLSAIAARNGVSVADLAAANGLDPNGLLISGTHLSIGGGGGGGSGASAPATSSYAPEGAASSDAGGGAQPTAESVSPSEVASIAAANGVSPSLAEAIGYQESGFNNAEVSGTGATGVMQIEPGTWDYIGSQLGGGQLSPTSAADNVRGGVLLLRHLLDQTGGDPALAAAGYYQGLHSVLTRGMYGDTQQYVNDVMALRQRFGGG